jgi:hypothetical protein
MFTHAGTLVKIGSGIASVAGTEYDAAFTLATPEETM